MSDHEIHAYLTLAQVLKYRIGASFQLSNSQLKEIAGKHRVDIHLEKSNYQNVFNAVQNGKGYRFSAKKRYRWVFVGQFKNYFMVAL